MKTFEQYNKKEYTLDELELGDKIMLNIPDGYGSYTIDIKKINNKWVTYRGAFTEPNSILMEEDTGHFFKLIHVINHIKKEDWDEFGKDSDELGLL